jgi:hypothetical protein
MAFIKKFSSFGLITHSAWMTAHSILKTATIRRGEISDEFALRGKAL